MDLINEIFDNMDKWRHIPSFQLTAFFELFVARILEFKYNVEIVGLLPWIPTTITLQNPNFSYRIDYLAKVRDADKLFFVDIESYQSRRHRKQYRVLEDVKEVGMENLLKDLEYKYHHPRGKCLYSALFAELERLGFIHMGEDGRYKPIEKEYEIQTVYIQPQNLEGDKNVLSFYEVAEVLSRMDDPISTRFASSLILWAEYAAGFSRIV